MLCGHKQERGRGGWPEMGEGQDGLGCVGLLLKAGPSFVSTAYSQVEN